MVGPPLSALAAAALAEASSPDMELIQCMDLYSILQSVRKSPSNSIIYWKMKRFQADFKTIKEIGRHKSDWK